VKYKQKTKSYDHQTECLNLSWDRKAFGIFLEQGLGKTKIALDTAGLLFAAGRIDGVLVVAPKVVYRNWPRVEIPIHLGCDYKVLEWDPGKAKTDRWRKAWKELLKSKDLAIFCINVEAFSNRGQAFDAAEKFLLERKSLMVVDESSRIKNPTSQRTRRVILLGKRAKFRRAMTGTPVTQTPFDLFAQFRFLDPSVLGFTSFYGFKHQYGVFEKQYTRAAGASRAYEELVKYVRLDELKSKIQNHSYRKTKAECLDIPDKIYQRVAVEMTPEQKKMYADLMKDGEIVFDSFEVLANLQIVRLLRCQQILGGFVPATVTIQEGEVDLDAIEVAYTPGKIEVKPVPGGNPKLDALIDLVSEDYPGKAIIWARFRTEIEAITVGLKEKFGSEAVVELHGGIVGDKRDFNVQAFQEDVRVRFLVGQQQSGIGVTLTAAETVFYYSNTFSYEQRYQSEDRAHRIGTKHSVTYVDLECAGTVDERIRDVLLGAKSLADAVMKP